MRNRVYGVKAAPGAELRRFTSKETRKPGEGSLSHHPFDFQRHLGKVENQTVLKAFCPQIRLNDGEVNRLKILYRFEFDNDGVFNQ